MLPEEYIVKCNNAEETYSVEKYYYKDKSEIKAFFEYVICLLSFDKSSADSIETFIRDEYKHLPVYSFQEWEELKDFPKKWCIKVTKKNKSVVNKWKMTTEFTENLYEFKYTYVSPIKGGMYNVEDHAEITFEQFKKYVLKQEVMEKKIIGWKLKDDCQQYEDAASKIALDCYCNFSVLFDSDVRAVELWKQAGVLDLWFTPVYEEEKSFKVGDWVKTFNKGVSPNGEEHAPNGGSGFKSNITLKIRRIDNYNNYDVYFFEDHDYGIFSGNFRKATTEEIKEHLIKEAKKRGFKEGIKIDKTPLNYEGSKICTLRGGEKFKYDPEKDILEWIASADYIYKDGKWAEIIQSYPQITINGYKGEFFDNYVKFGCATISRYIFTDLYNSTLLERTHSFGNKEITSITIGKGTFTVEQIKEIAEYYLNK